MAELKAIPGGQTVIKVDLAYTRNMGNYENLRINVGIEDYRRDGETTDTAMDRVYNFVESKLIEKMQEIEKELKGK